MIGKGETMRRVYLVYQPVQGDRTTSAGSQAPWAFVAIALLDTADLSYQATGMGGSPRHHYDAFLRMKERGDAALEDTLTWDDEVWTAVDIGPITAEDSSRDIVDRVRDLRPPASLPAPSRTDASS